MRSGIIIIIILGLAGQLLFAQKKLPVIKATSEMTDIKDGNNLRKGVWRISPRLHPDVYKSSSKNKKITFYTDIDSISFILKPDKPFNFIILLNNKDSAYTKAEYQPGFLDILKDAGKYNFSDKRKLNHISYKSIDNPDLKILREKFNLDSIAGTNDEFSKIKNLLFWVHNTFRYDGSKDVPEFTNIADLMTKCISNNGSLHCGAFAWVLNECYQALGFKSGQVVCLPKDSSDHECHSIITVYSNTLKKWLYMDPANCAYVMDKKKNPLSIAEVREYLVSEKPLLLNPEANINKQPVLIENYLYEYMAKNLYAFQRYSDKDGESISNVLLPVEYKGVFTHTVRNKPKYTNNPNMFWVKP
jgi:hypothetical protein